jgi:hypothetical protein
MDMQCEINMTENKTDVDGLDSTTRSATMGPCTETSLGCYVNYMMRIIL